MSEAAAATEAPPSDPAARRAARLRTWSLRAWWGGLAWAALGWTSALDWLIGELTVSWGVHVAVLLLAAAGFWLARGARGRAALSLAGAALGATPWIAQLGDTPAAAIGAGQPAVRVLVANTFYAPPRSEALIADVEGTGADLVALVEPPVSLPAAFAKTGRWRVLAEHLPGNKNNIALLVRTAARHVEVLESSVVTLDYTPSRPLEAVIRVGGAELHVLAAHPPAPTEPTQHSQRLRLVPDLAGRLRSPGILMADLNATRASPLWRVLMKADLRRPPGRAPGTWPSIFGPLAVSIDYVLVQGGLTTSEAEPVWLTGSDHRGVVVDVGVPAGLSP